MGKPTIADPFIALTKRMQLSQIVPIKTFNGLSAGHIISNSYLNEADVLPLHPAISA